MAKRDAVARKPKDTKGTLLRMLRYMTHFKWVLFGVMLLLQSVFGLVTYEWILSLWPVILICLGVELLLSNLLTRKIVYDKAAVCLMVLMAFFAGGMAITDVCLKASEAYLNNYNM